MGVLDRLLGGSDRGADDAPYVCIGCGAEYEKERRYCIECNSTVEENY